MKARKEPIEKVQPWKKPNPEGGQNMKLKSPMTKRAEKVEKPMDALDDVDDVVNVHTNAIKF